MSSSTQPAQPAQPTKARRSVFSAIGAGLTMLRTFFANLVFVLLLLVVVLAVVDSSGDAAVVPDGGALVLDLRGPIIEARPRFDAVEFLFEDENAPSPVLLRDLLEALDEARDDDRIRAVVVDLSGFPGAAPATLRSVGDALDAFRESGKPVYVGADYLGQSQYLLASHADHLYLNPMGQVLLRGFSVQPTYYAEALERLKVNVHVFRVGDYKSAVEPFVRSDMSDAAREANQALIDGLWSAFREEIARNRQLPADAIDRLIDELPERLRAVDGDLARLALETGLVDELLSRDAFRARLVAEVGEEEEGDGFRGIPMGAYLTNVRLARLPASDDAATVGIVVAEGTITGEDDGSSVGEGTAAMVRAARNDDAVKAIVLRVNSPGGSAFFSEVLRHELELAQLQGKPVVASFGGVAASGGYWIAATADRILAQPDTITGSIGIFGILPTFEDSAEAIGVNADGVRTHALAGAGNPLEPIDPAFADLLQQSVERGYAQFLDIVARGRSMSPEAVDEIAQGRVWLGSRAQELGLVDELGGLEDAVVLAADIAGLADHEVRYLEPPRTTREELLTQFFAGPVSGLLAGALDGPSLRELRSVSEVLSTPLRTLASLTDPQHVYALCGGCRTP